jgi:hypothetical protein
MLAAFVVSIGPTVIVNGDEFETIELRKATGNNTIVTDAAEPRTLQADGSKALYSPQQPNAALLGDLDRQRDSSGYGSESGDMLRELVKNKELMKTPRRKNLSKLSSLDSDISEGSTLVSTSSDNLDMLLAEPRTHGLIRHHHIRQVNSDSEIETLSLRSSVVSAM